MMIKRSANRRRRGWDAAAADDKRKNLPGPSPNPVTNLILADIALRSSTRLVRHAVERLVLGAKYPPGKADEIIEGRSLKQVALGAVLARIATRSVPGALLVGGGMLARTLYDRTKDRRASRKEGEKDLEEQADNA